MLSSGGLRLSRAPSEVGTERNDPRRVQGLDRIIAALDVVRARVTNARMSAKSRMEMAPQLLKSKKAAENGASAALSQLAAG